MTQPTSYVPATDFSAEEAASTSGRSTVRTAQLDAELAAVSLTLTQTLSNLAVIQRDDTELKDQIVKTHTLHPDVLVLLGSGSLVPRGSWLTATAYAVKDLVDNGGTSYICATAHTAGTFSTDLAAGKWMTLSLAPNSAVTNHFKTGSTTPTTAPTAAGTDTMAIGNGAVVTGTRGIALGKSNASGTDSIAIQIADNTTTYGAQATGAVAIGNTVKAGAQNAVAIGAGGQASGQSSVAIGSGTAAATASIIIGGGGSINGTADGAVLIGGGGSVGAGATYSAILGGNNAAIGASASYAVVVGGQAGTPTAPCAATVGGRYLRSRLNGQMSWGAQAAGAGEGQASHVVAQGTTTNATPTSIYTENSTGTRILIASGTTAAFSILVCARRTDVTGEAAAYKFEGLIANNAGTTAIVGSVTKTVLAESAAAWDCAVTADNTNDAIDISVTGEAGKTIKWAANVTMVEIGLT